MRTKGRNFYYICWRRVRERLCGFAVVVRDIGTFRCCVEFKAAILDERRL